VGAGGLETIPSPGPQRWDGRRGAPPPAGRRRWPHRASDARGMCGALGHQARRPRQRTAARKNRDARGCSTDGRSCCIRTLHLLGHALKSNGFEQLQADRMLTGLGARWACASPGASVLGQQQCIFARPASSALLQATGAQHQAAVGLHHSAARSARCRRQILAIECKGNVVHSPPSRKPDGLVLAPLRRGGWRWAEQLPVRAPGATYSTSKPLLTTRSGRFLARRPRGHGRKRWRWARSNASRRRRPQPGATAGSAHWRLGASRITTNMNSAWGTGFASTSAAAPRCQQPVATSAANRGVHAPQHSSAAAAAGRQADAIRPRSPPARGWSRQPTDASRSAEGSAGRAGRPAPP